MTIEFSAQARLGAFYYDARFEASGEILVLFGHSGAGKSLTLQFVSGLMRPDRGRIVLDGQAVFDSHRSFHVRPQERRVGYVVQDLALFPHLTVAENVGFSLPRGRAADLRVRQLLVMLGLHGYESRRPATLSGGQQQRVALARALARDARTLLLDEPFSALDESLRSSLRRELLRLRRDLGLTILFVTHDLREAHLLADRLAVFDAGRILQLGPREEVFRRPLNRRVAELTGVANILPGHVAAIDASHVTVDVDGLALRCVHPANGSVPGPGTPVDLAIRAERVNLRRVAASDGRTANLFPAEVTEEFAYGSSHTLHLRPLGAGPDLVSELAARPYEVLGVGTQKTWTVELPAEDLHLMPAQPQGALAPPAVAPAP